MIYCGSGSYFGKVLVPVPALVPVPIPDPDLLSTVFQQQKICTESCLTAFFSRKLAFNFSLFYFCITSDVESVFKSGHGTGTGIQYGSGSAKAKNCGSNDSGFGYTTLKETQARIP
jgi:hypothetical protein